MWRIFSQFSGRCVTSQLTLILCPLLLHPHLSYHPLQVHVIVIAINHCHPYPHDDILLYERCCREKCVERSLGNVTLINFVAGRGGEQAAGSYMCLFFFYFYFHFLSIPFTFTFTTAICVSFSFTFTFTF